VRPRDMTSHTFKSPKVLPVKVASAHRPTEVHQEVPRPEPKPAKGSRPRRTERSGS
jgi:hypothetical protein